MITSLIFVVIFLLVISLILFHIYQRIFNINFSKKSPPVVATGILPFLGDLNLMKPGFREYIDSLHKKHGNIFTLYSSGAYWTFISGNENYKKFLTAKESVISSQSFLEAFLKPMQPMDMKTMVKINDNIDFFKLSHQILNQSDYLSRFVGNIETIIKNEKLDSKMDLFEMVYKMIFIFNLKNFGGDEIFSNHKDEFFELFKKIDYSKLNVPLEVLKKTFGIQTPSQKAYQRMEELWKPIIEQRLKKRKNLESDQKDVLDKVVDLVVQKVEVEKLNVEEHKVVTMIMFNFFIAAQITTSNTCGWMFYHILSNEKLQKSILEEVEKAPSPITLDYLENNCTLIEHTIIESVRFGLLGIGGRQLKEDVEFESYTVPKGNILMHPNFGRAQHFTDSETFNPFRYLERDEHKNVKEYSHSFTPFGLGRHPCAGRLVALFGLKVFVIQMFKMYKMELINHPKRAPTCMQNFNKQVLLDQAFVKIEKK